MIVDTQDPRDVEIPQSPVRSKNTIKSVVFDIIHQMRGDGRGDRDLDLDDTRSRLRGESSTSLPPTNDSEFRANDRRVQIPQWLLLFLILQGAGIIWWAATIQSDLKYLQLENAKLWTTLQAVDKTVEDGAKDLDSQIRNTVKDEIANQLLNRGIIRVQPTP